MQSALEWLCMMVSSSLLFSDCNWLKKVATCQYGDPLPPNACSAPGPGPWGACSTSENKSLLSFLPGLSLITYTCIFWTIMGYFCPIWETYAYSKSNMVTSVPAHIFSPTVLFLFFPHPLKFPYHCNEIWQLTYYDRVMTLWLLMAQGQTATKASHY